MFGYSLILIYALVLAGIRLKRSKSRQQETIREFLFLQGRVKTPILTCNVFASWFWATSVIGAAEASYLYGISGGFAYVLGASLGFGLMIVSMVRINRQMGEPSYLTAYIKKRFSPSTQKLFFAFAVLVAIYIMVEQAVGIGLVFSAVFDISFKKIAFFSMIIAIAFLLLSGIRGVLINDGINFVMVAGLLVWILVSIVQWDSNGFFGDSVADAGGLLQGRGEFGNVFSISAMRYFIIAIIVAFAQSVMDQSYWVKGKAAQDEKTYIQSLLLGGLVIWIPITLCCSLVFGYLAYSSNYARSTGESFGNILVGHILSEGYARPLAILFAFMMLCIVMTTIINCLLGILSLATEEIYQSQITNSGSDREALRFGMIFTALTGIFCGLIALSLENISLLSIDTFSGIFFAAPCATLSGSLILNKKFKSLGIPSTILGILAGLFCWLYLTDPETDGFVAVLVSFGTSFGLLILLQLFLREKINLRSLRM